MKCPIFASYTLAFALQLRKKHEKTSVRVVKSAPIFWWQQYSTHLHINCTQNMESGTYISYDIFVNCNWVDTRWQQYNTHLHTNST